MDRAPDAGGKRQMAAKWQRGGNRETKNLASRLKQSTHTGLSNRQVTHKRNSIPSQLVSILRKQILVERGAVGIIVSMPLTLNVSIVTRRAVSPKQIRALRKTLNLTQQELAGLIAAQRVTVARWEIGTSRPTGAYLKLLMELKEKATAKKTKRR